MAQAILPSTLMNPSKNGFDLVALGDVVEQVTQNPDSAIVGFRVRSEWRGAAKVQSRVSEYEIGGETVPRTHVIESDEPRELFGSDSAPNPQELLFAAVNACMIFGYVTKAAAMGIDVHRLSIESKGQLDMRGALGVADVPPGIDAYEYVVHLHASGTDAELQELHQAVMAGSPNRYHLTHPIRLVPTLLIER